MYCSFLIDDSLVKGLLKMVVAILRLYWFLSEKNCSIQKMRKIKREKSIDFCFIKE